MADECHGALDLPTESLDFTHGFSWTLQLSKPSCGYAISHEVQTDEVEGCGHARIRWKIGAESSA